MLPAPSCMTPQGHKFMLGRGRRGKFVGFGAWKVEHLFGKGKELSWLCLPRERSGAFALSSKEQRPRGGFFSFQSGYTSKT